MSLAANDHRHVALYRRLIMRHTAQSRVGISVLTIILNYPNLLELIKLTSQAHPKQTKLKKKLCFIRPLLCMNSPHYSPVTACDNQEIPCLLRCNTCTPELRRDLLSYLQERVQ